MHTTITITISRVYCGGTSHPDQASAITAPTTSLEPLVIHRPDDTDTLTACQDARTELVGEIKQQFGEEVARLAGRSGDYASMQATDGEALSWTVYAANDDVLGVLEGHIATSDDGSYKLEIRVAFEGTEAEARAAAQRLANEHGGEVTAIFDVDNGYDEI